MIDFDGEVDGHSARDGTNTYLMESDSVRQKYVEISRFVNRTGYRMDWGVSAQEVMGWRYDASKTTTA